MRLLHFVCTIDYVKWIFLVFAKVGKAGFWVMLQDFKIKISSVISLLYKTNRFHVAVHLFSNRSQKTSNCGKNISDTLGYRLLWHLFCSRHILISSVIYYWTDVWQHRIYLQLGIQVEECAFCTDLLLYIVKCLRWFRDLLFIQVSNIKGFGQSI